MDTLGKKLKVIQTALADADNFARRHRGSYLMSTCRCLSTDCFHAQCRDLLNETSQALDYINEIIDLHNAIKVARKEAG